MKVTLIEPVLAPFAYDFEEYPGGPQWQGEWDWWHVYGGDDGGRSPGLYVAAGFERDARIIRNPTFITGDERPFRESLCDGGMRALLDFEAQRAPARERAVESWGKWTAFMSDFPPARTKTSFYRAAESAGRPLDEARAAFAAQPLIAAAISVPGIRRLWPDLGDPLVYFGDSVEDFARREASQVIPTNVLLTLDGRWIDGLSLVPPPAGVPQGEDFYLYADQYLEDLDPQAYVIRVRFHS